MLFLLSSVWKGKVWVESWGEEKSIIDILRLNERTDSFSFSLHRKTGCIISLTMLSQHHHRCWFFVLTHARTRWTSTHTHTHVQEASKKTYRKGKNYNLICVTVSGVAWYPSKIASGIENARSINYLLGASKCVEHVLS